MKAPVYKFVAFAFVGLMAISGFKADSHLFCDEVKAEAIASTESAQQVIDVSERSIQKRQQTEEEGSTFKFPNVFDALRFIF